MDIQFSDSAWPNMDENYKAVRENQCHTQMRHTMPIDDEPGGWAGPTGAHSSHQEAVIAA